MSFLGFGAATVADLSDSELDAKYKAVKDDIALNKRFSRQGELNEIVSEITDRLTSVYGFAGSLLSDKHRFPNYEKGTSFVPTAAAKESVKDSASAVASTVTTFAIGGSVTLLVLAAGAAYFYFRVLKK